MNIEKYSELREKVKNRDFEAKNRSLDTWFFKSTFLGNIGSVFFAFFLVYPALLKAISANLTQGNSATILATIVTILILVVFEYIKRIILTNLSLDLVSTKWNFADRGVAWWFILSLAIVSGSAYLSVVGARNFSQTSQKQNIIIENTIEADIDSIINTYNKRKNVLIVDNNQLRKSNVGLREKIDETPLNYRTVRRELQQLVDANIEAINANDEKIVQLDMQSEKEIAQMKRQQQELIQKNIKSNSGDIILFLLIASAIEFVIIFGIWFREYYDYNVFLISESKLEGIYLKKERYLTLLKFIFKEGIVGKDQKVIAISRLKEMIKEKSNIPFSNKLVDEFYHDMEHLGVLKTIGKRRFTATSFNEATEKINRFDDILRLLENLK